MALRTARGYPLWMFVGVLLGTLLIECAWSLVVPPFRGLDEHEHVFRAASVASGHWSARDVIPVDRGIVAAAQPECASLPDTACRPVGQTADGTLVYSAAARYNPLFYWVIGTAARPFHGEQAVYAMRAANAFLCSLLLAVAATVLTLRRRSHWPVVGFLLLFSPAVAYANSVAAPNGAEISAAVLLWSALLTLGRYPSDSPPVRRLLYVAALGAMPLAALRSLGPLWLVLIVCLSAALLGRERLAAVVRHGRLHALLVLAFMTLACLGGMLWTSYANTNAPGSVVEFPNSPWPRLPPHIALWTIQSIGTFPARDEPAPTLTYACFFAAWLGFLILGLAVASRRVRLGVASVFAISLILPVAISVRTYAQLGMAWQGRYGLPLALGVFLMLGWALDRKWVIQRHSGAALALICCMATVGSVAAQIGTRDNVLRHDTYLEQTGWQGPGTLLVATLTILGYAVMMIAACRARPRTPRRLVVRRTDRPEPHACGESLVGIQDFGDGARVTTN